MRVISGFYRGRVLRSPADHKTRPTSDRLRETLFNIFCRRRSMKKHGFLTCARERARSASRLYHAARRFTTFVDKSRRACALIEENLDQLKIPEEQTKIYCLTAENFVNREHTQDWDIVFFDPPYSEDYLAVLFEFGENGKNLLSRDGVLISEHHSKTNLPDEIGSLRRWRILKQGETCLSFYERN